MIYLELAEQGLGVAQLNTAILFNQYDVIDSDRTLAAQVAKRNGDTQFNINKHLAFKYFKMATLQRETEDEASLKLGDFYYYG